MFQNNQSQFLPKSFSISKASVRLAMTKLPQISQGEVGDIRYLVSRDSALHGHNNLGVISIRFIIGFCWRYWRMRANTRATDQPISCRIGEARTKSETESDSPASASKLTKEPGIVQHILPPFISRRLQRCFYVPFDANLYSRPET